MVILGDIHRDFKVLLEHKKEGNIIQVGDFGLGFNRREKEESTMDYYNEILQARHIHVYAIRGNHDDPSYWDGRYEGKWSNITLVPDYTVMRLEHQNYLFMGGALSIDRIVRKEGRDYWKDEEFVYDEDKLIGVLKDSQPIDYVVTHTAPDMCEPIRINDLVRHYASLDPTDLIHELEIERAVMTRAYNVICEHSKPKKWFYGHFHYNYTEVIEGVEFMLLGIGKTTNV